MLGIPSPMRAALCFSLVLLLAASPAAWAAGTRTESVTYYPPPEAFATTFPVHLGMVLFASYPTDTSVTVVADDEMGLPVSLYACQDLDGDGICGEMGEPNVVGCASLTVGAAQGFTPGRHVHIGYNNVFRFLIGGCEGISLATTGTLTATFTTR